uniref:Protein krueppel n=1 Tax=Rodentolepis nana TaxID=102285 RepID=A0A0R3T4A8_RODNA
LINTAHNYFYCPSCNFNSEDRYRVRIHYQTVHQQNMNSTTSLGMFPVIYFFIVILAPNSNEGNNLPKKTGPSDEIVDNIATMSKETSNEERLFTCDVCRKTFKCKEKLNVHKRRHSDKKPFVCEACGKRFLTKAELNTHKAVHSDEKPYNCRICGRKFKTKSLINSHLRTHSEERPFECGYCKRGFKRKDALNVHMRTHSGERPYKCCECNKQFLTKQNMQTHLYYKNLTDLKGHMSCQTRDQPFKCNVCAMSFSSIDDWNLHKLILFNLIQCPNSICLRFPKIAWLIISALC